MGILRRSGVFACVAAALCLLLATPALAQNPTGTLTGTVEDADGAPVPGVTVTAESPALQGARVTTTNNNGTYKLAFLPPGLYTVTYELAGFANTTREVRISAAQTQTSDIELQLDTVSEEIVVTSRLETISETGTGATTIAKDELESLPVQRDIDSAVLLTPGTHATGPGGNVTISGAMSFENLWTVNGVVINENVRGQELPLFIEDAIQETTTITSGVSAEYGRFTGGVINAITKSGGNQFDGSLRVNFANDDWIADVERRVGDRTIESPERLDEVNEIYEATFGGYFLRDHLWFFGAGRDREESAADQTFSIETQSGDILPGFDYDTGLEEERIEGKLTISPTASHSIIGSWLDIDRVTNNSRFGRIIDLRSLNPQRTDPQEIISGNYTGILTEQFFVEAQYSERDFSIGIGSGGPQGDLINGTVMRDRTSGNRFWSPTFCGSCETEERNNENFLAKGSYFLSTGNAGTHDLVFGYDTFDDIRFSINHQSGSDFTIYSSDLLVDPNTREVFPQIGGNAWLRWFAVINEDLAQPTNFTTNSYYVNDAWQLNDRWSFNLGVRFDENDGVNSAGDSVADDSKVSPRLGVSWDVNGDGDLIAHASFGTYVAAVANTRADATSNGGAIGSLLWFYRGTPINADPACIDRGDCTPTGQAIQQVFDWYIANGGTFDITADDISGPESLFFTFIPGQTSIIPDTIKSPSADEITVGINKRLGSKGSFRADVVLREWEDFYSNRTTLDTGTVETPGGPTDLTFVGNFGDDVLEREYIGLHTQFRYRALDRLTFAGNYTLSELEGNINGETGPSGPVPSSPFSYPQYHEPRWAFPVGDLGADQRHKVRAWAIYDVLRSEHNTLSVSLLQNFFSGTPYGAVGSIDPRPFVDNPGFLDPPTSQTYFFTDRDAFTTEDITRTDVSLNYAFRWGAFGRDLEIFLQPEVLNVFNEDGAVSVNTTITDPTEGAATFNPFTETPVEGVNWIKGANFGEPDDDDDLQFPRTFRFSVGFRF